MSPQLLSRIRASGNYIFANSVLTENPELGVLVARAIAGWSITEAHLGNTFAHLIGAKKPAAASVAIKMYASLRGFDLQRALLEAAAEELLPKRSAQVFAATLVVLTREATTRHHFAHWIWGRSTDSALSKDALLLVEPKRFWQLRGQKIRHWRKRDKIADDTRMLLTEPRLSQNAIYVYRKAELEQICNRMEEAFKRAEALARVASSEPRVRRLIQNQLAAVPEIHQQLSKMTQAAKSNP